MKHKYIYRLAALALCIALCLTAAGCGKSEESGYRVLDTIDCGEYAIAFRAGDTVLRDYVDAAISTLAAAGNVHQIALNWFSDDPTNVKGNKGALTDLLATLEIEAPPERVLIVGVREDARPMSFRNSDGSFDGFDIELAEMVCSVLGWELRLQNISAADVAVELKSGNIDCAWGGMCLAEDPDSYCLSPGYMPCSYKLITTLSSGIKKKSQLAGKILGMPLSTGAVAAAENEAFYEKLSETVDCASITESFMSLKSGRCDVILVDAYTAAYYI